MMKVLTIVIFVTGIVLFHPQLITQTPLETNVYLYDDYQYDGVYDDVYDDTHDNGNHGDRCFFLWPTILITHCPRPDPDQTTIMLIILIFEEDCDDREEEIIAKRMMTMQ